MTTPTLPSLSRPEDWWRHLCWIGDHRIALCGDLPVSDDAAARAQLAGWLDAGVTHIVDVRGEWSDEPFVAAHAPQIDYVWLGTHDNGGPQEGGWFDAGVAAILEALSHPHAKVVIHCHMGVNRAPSMAFAALLGLGIDPVSALDEIRSARPIAAIGYADDAIAWWAGAHPAGSGSRDVRRAVRTWMRAHPVDVGWIISRIRRAE